MTLEQLKETGGTFWDKRYRDMKPDELGHATRILVVLGIPYNEAGSLGIDYVKSKAPKASHAPTTGVVRLGTEGFLEKLLAGELTAADAGGSIVLG